MIIRSLLFSILLFPVLITQGQERLSPKEFRKKLDNTSDAFLLDVRTPEETAKGYLKGAVFMDFYDSSFKEQVSVIDKEKPVFV